MLAVQGDGQSKQENSFYFLVVQPVSLLQVLVATWQISHWVPTDSPLAWTMDALKVGHIYDFSFILECTHLVHPSRWQQQPWSLGLAL